ncbi:hypothetical protein [Amycolatopsis pigmentata]
MLVDDADNGLPKPSGTAARDNLLAAVAALRLASHRFRGALP